VRPSGKAVRDLGKTVEPERPAARPRGKTIQGWGKASRDWGKAVRRRLPSRARLSSFCRPYIKDGPSPGGALSAGPSAPRETPEWREAAKPRWDLEKFFLQSSMGEV
jgi:hypothetical protein